MCFFNITLSGTYFADCFPGNTSETELDVRSNMIINSIDSISDNIVKNKSSWSWALFGEK